MRCLLPSFILTLLMVGLADAQPSQNAAIRAVMDKFRVGDAPGAQPNLPPELLKPLFKPGQLYRFHTATDVLVSPYDQPQRRIWFEQQARYEVAAREPSDGEVSVLGLTEKLRVHIATQEQSVNYDSLQKTSSQTLLGQHFETAVNRRVQIELDTNMRVISHRESGPEVAASPLAGLPLLGPDELLQIVKNIGQGYSSDPVGLGSEWTHKGKRTVGALGELGFDIHYRHLGVVRLRGRQCYKIEFQGGMTADLVDAESLGTSFQGSQLNGILIYDPGIEMTRFSEQSVSMQVNFTDETGQKQVIPLTQKVTVRLMQVVDQ